METKKETKKVYLEIVSQLREMIFVDRLVAGDKIPSERELSERLQVGRSSVREALRALELLGLIETRRGEGTFIRDFRDHQLVHLLSTFILQDVDAKNDVVETKVYLEMDGLDIAIARATESELAQFKQWAKTHKYVDDVFFEKVMRLTNNKLMLKIWLVLQEYFHATKKGLPRCEDESYRRLADAMYERNQVKAKEIYEKEMRDFTILPRRHV